MPADWGQELLNVSQDVRQKAPFLLLLAGTPGLREQMSSINASFWTRSEVIPLSRLDEQGAAAAIVQPLLKEGISLDPDVMSQVVSESQHYPFFIQVWGAALWNTARKAECTQIDQALLTDAWSEFNYRKNLFYQNLYNEMIEEHVTLAALSVAKAFKDRQAISYIELSNILAGRMVGIDPPDDVLATIRELKNLGYIWQGSASSDWQPGIPSLMTHVLTEAQKLTPDNSGDLSPGM